MEERKKTYFNMKIVIGLVVVAAGVVLLLENLGFGIEIRIWDYWPVPIILIGIGKILQPKGSRQIYWGVLLMGIGTLFQLNNLGIIDFRFDDLWPIIIILVGIAILRGSLFKKATFCVTDDGRNKWKSDSWCKCFSSKKQPAGNDHIDITTILGGGDYNISSKQFKGGEVTAIMGGCDLDFSKAEIAGDKERVVIDTTVIMGAIEMRVPPGWQVVVQSEPILGAVEDRTVSPKEPGKKIVIKGSVIMGAIEIKN